ncbi:MAG: AMP-binding protein [Rhodospirillaceae bacterium]|mgnify:FL=1|jgi:acetyl-CoA synthetase|nr:AMP-binding protein [Rhodospirillaceae bacterium]MBT3495318.1 AMP-binding protein [Rhodospirillaceae bacterium]MBT3781961.1 AMP-binding protein [Rhodospirillaceae bacterium]MBT3979621.1 AMP-binding protein [Rhodospirillaceae bacterium]MBT4166821.1 AMP-binding protein [Rhodospirillaceae bacterium]
MSEIVWRAEPSVIADSNIQRFMDSLGVADYDDLLARAAADPDWFWEQTIEFMGFIFDTPYERVRDASAGVPWTRWCVGGTTNATLNFLDKHRDTPTYQKDAIRFEAEDGAIRTWSYQELDQQTCRLAAALTELGLGPDDKIGIYMPMVPEVAAAFFATARIGAIAVPLFSGFGQEAIATRLNDAGATAVITVDATWRRGRSIPMKPVMDEALKSIPSVRHQIVLRANDEALDWDDERDHDWIDIVAGKPDFVPATIVAAEHPLLLVYTSGTSGKPKGTLLSHVGFVVKISFDLLVCLDLKPADRMMWISDFGWVVGPMITTVCTLAGATMVLVEGTPDYPDPDRMWRLCEQHGVSFLGVAPTTIRGLMRGGTDDIKKWNLDSVRVVASTGEPWTDEAWNWCFEHVCRRLAPLFNWTGGTETSGGILVSTMVHPLKSCSFGGSVPGMAADILDDAGNPVGPGEVGELVLTIPSIGMTRGLWQDDERYIESYWSMYPDIWRHGDWASRDEDGLWYVQGRSDDTLKIGGKRTGPAEIEGLVMASGLIAEAAAVGLPDPRAGQSVMCVCVPSPGVAADENTANQVRDAVAAGLGHAFRPKDVLFVSDLPKTRNMKIMRRVVKAAVLGQNPGDLTALVNPEAVDDVARAAGQGG